MINFLLYDVYKHVQETPVVEEVPFQISQEISFLLVLI